jgi:hypothetical protein
VFKSTPWIPSAAEPACGATEFLLRQPPRKRAKKNPMFVLSLHAHCMLALLLHAEQVNESKLVCV